ncbi:MAG: prepilin peptidase, partial [bacterium]|nr:prepilin peptidase [bacterium]
ISPLTMLIGGLAVFVFFFLQFLISKGAWIGGGDLRMGALIGVLLGWEKGLLAVIISYFIGAILSIYLLATKKVGRKSTIPFGPFLVIGTLISIFYGQEILDWYLTTLLF